MCRVFIVSVLNLDTKIGDIGYPRNLRTLLGTLPYLENELSHGVLAKIPDRVLPQVLYNNFQPVPPQEDGDRTDRRK